MQRFTQDMTLMGTVGEVDGRSFQLTCRSGDSFPVRFGRETVCSPVSNLDNLQRDRVPTPDGFVPGDPEQLVSKYVRPGRLLVVEGVYQEDGDRRWLDARNVHLAHSDPSRFEFEETHWWLTQIARMADKWLDDLFGERRSYRADDFAELYHTNLNIIGLPTDDNVQEMATLSRLIYGLSSAYLLTGTERYFLAARAGVEFQRITFRTLSHDGNYCFWAYGKRRGRYGTRLIEPSENSDDAGTLPLYEQIYALAGLAQYYRITNDQAVLHDIRRTVRAMNDFYLDDKGKNPEFPGHAGYFSHLDYATMRPDLPALGDNQARKNWNSIGDHCPAYLLNLLLALDPMPNDDGDLKTFLDECRHMLDVTSRLIVEKFPDPDPTVPFVRERFFADWTPDLGWRWQQNRAVVGHNLKIAWNLTRMANYFRMAEQPGKAKDMIDLAVRLADNMATIGIDQYRSGCFDTVERRPVDEGLDFPWRNTKDFWQQEQAILAYLILYGETRDARYLDLARELSFFWNLYFPDRDNGGIYFRVTDNGVPVIGGQYGNKGGHSIAGYHSFELNYLAHIYVRTHLAPVLGGDQNFCLHFRPRPGLRSINVLPDAMRPGDIEIASVRVNGVLRDGIPPSSCQISLDDIPADAVLTVEFRPTTRLVREAEEAAS